jgi:hypothetical protein
MDIAENLGLADSLAKPDARASGCPSGRTVPSDLQGSVWLSYLKSEIARWTPIIKASNIKAD